MKLFIKNMISHCSQLMVTNKLNEIGLNPKGISRGEVELDEKIGSKEKNLIKVTLKKIGLDVLEDKRQILIEKIKNSVIEMIYFVTDRPDTNYSDFISEKVDYEYSYVSNLFSKETGLTIQQYIILLKVERAKELIMYDDLNLKEISYSLHYSSVPHFCSQFKKVTGMTPSYFKSLKDKNRCQLEDVINQTENIAALVD